MGNLLKKTVLLSLTLFSAAVQQTKDADMNICSGTNLYSLRSSRNCGSYDSKRIIMTFASWRQTSQFLLHFSHYLFPLYSPLSPLVLSKPYLVFVCTVYNAVKALGVCLFSHMLCSSHPVLSMAGPHVYR